ncbi:hypothetical protein PG985_008740 [Apiospora marii]|uniref:uncharacterized protein n=1 Tax=Apiospora marii TaxID=335849 RepID=UPI00312FC2E7
MSLASLTTPTVAIDVKAISLLDIVDTAYGCLTIPWVVILCWLRRSSSKLSPLVTIVPIAIMTRLLIDLSVMNPLVTNMDRVILLLLGVWTALLVYRNASERPILMKMRDGRPIIFELGRSRLSSGSVERNESEGGVVKLCIQLCIIRAYAKKN